MLGGCWKTYIAFAFAFAFFFYLIHFANPFIIFTTSIYNKRFILFTIHSVCNLACGYFKGKITKNKDKMIERWLIFCIIPI
jgi:hypothetical protein